MKLVVRPKASVALYRALNRPFTSVSDFIRRNNFPRGKVEYALRTDDVFADKFYPLMMKNKKTANAERVKKILSYGSYNKASYAMKISAPALQKFVRNNKHLLEEN